VNNIVSAVESLRSHQWFKLICGASFQHLPSIRNLALVYTLAGADCLDLAPDPAVINAAKAGIEVALKLSQSDSLKPNHLLISPLIMVSFNAGEDPHFRKAKFEANLCPSTCDRPCISICPTSAINSHEIIQNLCYGCGRCIPICPPQIIYTQQQIYTVADIKSHPIQAIEIHTHIGCSSEFEQLWQQLGDFTSQLQVISVSFPDDENLKSYLLELLEIMQPLPSNLIWQTDGRPMSGDIGDGTTRAALLLAQKVRDFNLPSGYIQLAGGTNGSTISKIDHLNLVNPETSISGVAYGSYARKLIADLLEMGGDYLEAYPDLLDAAVARAKSLVLPHKMRQR
jgi:Fe-S-cluster-containing hydrogenase component 2